MDKVRKTQQLCVQAIRRWHVLYLVVYYYLSFLLPHLFWSFPSLLTSFYQFVFPPLLWSCKVPAVFLCWFFRGLFFWESLILFLRCTAQSCFYVSTLYFKVLFLRCTAKSCQVAKLLLGPAVGERNYCTFKQNGPHSPAAIFVQSWLQTLAGPGNWMQNSTFISPNQLACRVKMAARRLRPKVW